MSTHHLPDTLLLRPLLLQTVRDNGASPCVHNSMTLQANASMVDAQWRLESKTCCLTRSRELSPATINTHAAASGCPVLPRHGWQGGLPGLARRPTRAGKEVYQGWQGGLPRLARRPTRAGKEAYQGWQGGLSGLARRPTRAGKEAYQGWQGGLPRLARRPTTAGKEAYHGWQGGLPGLARRPTTAGKEAYQGWQGGLPGLARKPTRAEFNLPTNTEQWNKTNA